jgi:hypothetical protein
MIETIGEPAVFKFRVCLWMGVGVRDIKSVHETFPFFPSLG